MMSIHFIDHEVPYEVFLNDLVNKLVQALRERIMTLNLSVKERLTKYSEDAM